MFHVPEECRIVMGSMATTAAFGNNGAFVINNRAKKKGRAKRELWVIASDGGGWEHISVHVYNPDTKSLMTPLWEEMCYVKDLFWDEEDVVMQLHPKKSEYVNNHPNVLHLWRPTDAVIPTPPSIFVGIKT